MNVQPYYHPQTGTFTYLVHDERNAVIIDPVADYTAASGHVDYGRCDRLLAALAATGARLRGIFETHAHADHLSGGAYLRDKTDAPLAIGEGIRKVQATFRPIFDLGEAFPVDGSQFDRLLADGERVEAGTLAIDVLHTPGHTSDSVTYRIGDAAFVGDTLFSPRLGSARCDFPGGDAAMLYRSIRRLYALPGRTRLFLCHDYPADGEDPTTCVTVDEQRAQNVHVRADTPVEDFVTLREARDATLAMPALIIPSIQVNIRAGALPEPAANGTRYLKTPLNRL